MFTYFVFFCFGSTEKSANRRRQKHLLHLILRLYLLFPSFFSFRFFCSNLEHFGETKEAIVKLRERVRKGHATLRSHFFFNPYDVMCGCSEEDREGCFVPLGNQ